MRKLVVQCLMFLCLSAPVSATGAAAGAGAMLFDLAAALDKKDIASLRELIDTQTMVYVGTILRAPGYPQNDPLEVLSRTVSLDALRRAEDLIFDRLGSGVAQNVCSNARWPGCPWVPESVARATQVTEIDNTTIYAVDNKHGIRTWLLLKVESGRWRAWAIAESDREARVLASREFQDTLARVRKELPSLIEANAKARAARQQSGQEEYEKRTAAIEQRNRAEKAAKDAVECRVLRISTEERDSSAALPPFRVLLLTLEVRNTNSFAILPKTWALIFSHPDGSQVKTVTLDHGSSGDAMPLSADERKTLTLTARSINGHEHVIEGWNMGTYSAKAKLLNFDRK